MSTDGEVFGLEFLLTDDCEVVGAEDLGAGGGAVADQELDGGDGAVLREEGDGLLTTLDLHELLVDVAVLLHEQVGAGIGGGALALLLGGYHADEAFHVEGLLLLTLLVVRLVRGLHVHGALHGSLVFLVHVIHVVSSALANWRQAVRALQALRHGIAVACLGLLLAGRWGLSREEGQRVLAQLYLRFEFIERGVVIAMLLGGQHRACVAELAVAVFGLLRLRLESG